VLPLLLFSELLLADTLGRDCERLVTALLRPGLLLCLWDETRSLLCDGAEERCVVLVVDLLASFEAGLTA